MLKYLTPIAATSILLLILLATSIPLFHWFDLEGKRDEYESGRELWRSHRIWDYDFTVQMTCFCGPPGNLPLLVSVRDGRAAGITDSSGRYLDDAVDTSRVPDTVPAMFEIVSDWFEDRPDSITVRYDERFGFPGVVEVDPREDRADDEISFTISDFQPQ